MKGYWGICCGLVLFTSVALGGQTPAPSAKDARLAVPAEDAQAQAEKSLREKYKTEYANTKPGAMLALAAKLLQPGRENRKDVAGWYVLLREARELAVQAGRPYLAMEAIDDLDRHFRVDALPMKIKALTTILKEGNEATARLVQQCALSQVDLALRRDDFATATRLLKVADEAASKTKAAEKAHAAVASRLKEVTGYRHDFQAYQDARTKLAAAPDDAAANLAVGKYLCFFHGRWAEGLPLLSKGSDARLKELAGKDLANPEPPEAQIAVGDGWWNLAESLPNREQTHAMLRAMIWYERAQPKAESFQREKVESRISKAQVRVALRIARWLPGSFYGRDVEDRILLLREGGGTMQSEEAVQRGLDWLVRHQSSSGMWSLDAFHKAGKCACSDPGQKFDIAGTAFGLLPLLGAGNTHATGPYARAVRKGIEFLLSKQKPEGNFSDFAYENALATMAVCEDFGLTRDPNLRGPAQKAVNFIARAQHEGGSWGYSAGTKGDTSVSGFQFTALKTGYYAGLKVPDVPFQRLARHLDAVADPSGRGYGYNAPAATPAMSAVGFMCREYLGWGPSNAALARGVDYLAGMQNFTVSTKPSMYFLYYATQTMHHFGGPKWDSWNAKVRDVLIATQGSSDSPNPHQAGSWSPSGDDWATQGGRLMATSLALLTLEVYYVNIPLYSYGQASLQD